MNEDAARETGVLGVANALVSYDPVYEGLVAQLLGRTLVVDTIDHAIVIQRKYRQTLRMVTLEGELLSPGGSMTGGSFRNNSNLLGRRREIEELEKSVQGLAKELREIQQELEEKKNKRNEIRDLRTELNEKLQRQYIEQNTVRLNLEKAREKKTEIRLDFEALQKESLEIENQIAEIERNRKVIGQEMQQLRDRLAPTPEGKVACSSLAAEAERMSRTTLEQRMNVYGADFAGVDSLLPAVLMTEMIARSLNLNDVIIPASGYDEEFSSSLIRAEQHPGDLEAEVLHFAGILADRYKADKGHREHVARLCMEMFDQLQDLHRLSEHDRLLLEVASILHEVGSFINQQNHQLHSQYIILNSEIFGLSRDDVETIALLARYHRHEVPANSDPMYGELELRDRMRVAKMAAILRVADALERGHAQRVNGVRAHIRGRMLELELQGVRETAVEDLALRLKGDLFADIFGYDVVLAPQR